MSLRACNGKTGVGFLGIVLGITLPLASSCGDSLRSEDEALLGSVTEQHVMIPMRDGKKLSAYLYIPDGEGPWPLLWEQRYADLRADRTRQSLANLASHGYVVSTVNFRGTHLSEGAWDGYRSLGWGERQDGYDTVEWPDGPPPRGGATTSGARQYYRGSSSTARDPLQDPGCFRLWVDLY